MTSQIEDVLRSLQRDWAFPKEAHHDGKLCPFLLRCSVVDASSAPHVERIPPDLAEFWRLFGGARLFEDVEYGQWGVILLSHELAMQRTKTFADERPKDYVDGDIVVGEFLGDSDLVIVRANPSVPDFGHVEIVLPIDRRENAYRVGREFSAFLQQYARAEGAKYWESKVPDGGEWN